jgi:hypothetical protein
MNSGANEKLMNRTKIFETILCSPGMQENCKIVLNPSRQIILALAKLIESGTENREGKEREEIISFLPEDSMNDLKLIAEELLKKSGLVEFYEHIRQL